MEGKQRGDIGKETKRAFVLASKRKKKKKIQSGKCTHVCEEEGDRETGRVGRKGRIEGGLLSASSDRREADLQQQVLEDRETESDTRRERYIEEHQVVEEKRLSCK